MTQEEKTLLLKDLCARLPYGVQILSDLDKEFDGGLIATLTKIESYNGDKFPNLKGQFLFYQQNCLALFTAEEIRPYLRPMSSMTEDEKVTYSKLFWNHDPEHVDWLNEHMFDYRGLIEKGLALEAKEGMYKN